MYNFTPENKGEEKMKKGLICLPLVATMLGGCSILGIELPGGELLSKLDFLHILPGNNNSTGGSGNNNTTGGGGNNTSGGGDVVDDDFDTNLGKEEILGYKRVDNPTDGGKYLLGYYDFVTKKMRFANGDYHKDDKGTYPYYLATTDNTATGAAEFQVDYVSEDEFTIHVTCSDSSKPWNNKYFGVYAATSSHANSVFSIAPCDDLNEQYTDLGGTKHDVLGVWKFYQNATVDGVTYQVNTIGAELVHPDSDTDPVLRMFGCKCYDGYNKTASGYVSIDCSAQSSCVATDYSIAHLYEKI